ncbi:hypothetical protein NPIL_357931, partial [Nephila pilipes]
AYLTETTRFIKVHETDRFEGRMFP